MLRELTLATEYRTGSDDPVSSFYLPCLSKSNRYYRAAGYFRSSILILVGTAFVDFAKRGGQAFLICSPEMEPEDIAAVNAGRATLQEAAARSVLRDTERLLQASAYDHHTKVLATLVASGCLQVKIAFKPESNGIYHEKLGCFEDSSNDRVTFIGSANETFRAWSTRGNYESVEVFCNWHSSHDGARTARHLTYLKSLYANRVPGLEVIDFPEAAKERLFTRSARSLEDLEFEKSEMPLPKGRKPLPHQEQALTSWEANGHRGILQHATGSGKTFTALLAIQRHVSQGSPAIILVPSQLLQAQWRREIAAVLPKASVLMVGGGHTRWKAAGVLRSQVSPELSPTPRVVLAVMASASSKEFTAQIKDGAHLLMVADEVHQVGSQEYSAALSIDAGKRLGLSATPTRFGDPDGTHRVLQYFGGILKPVVTLSDAIAAGRLVPYDYAPLAVRLTDEEADEWRALTKRLGFLLRSSDGTLSKLPEEAKRLLIRRSRVAKKAAAKLSEAVSIIRTHYEPGQRWIVYCEDVAHMEAVAEALATAGYDATLYHSDMQADPEQTLDWFDRQGGITLAVRCLDEGIDIPSVTDALILASSQNPRQFVQRRGRILRASPGKESARLFDVLVLPVDGADDPLASLESEFARAINFARDARNASALTTLLQLAVAAHVNVDKHFADMEGEIDVQPAR